jgi:hypothetical protein
MPVGNGRGSENQSGRMWNSIQRHHPSRPTYSSSTPPTPTTHHSLNPHSPAHPPAPLFKAGLGPDACRREGKGRRQAGPQLTTHRYSRRWYFLSRMRVGYVAKRWRCRSFPALCTCSVVAWDEAGKGTTDFDPEHRPLQPIAPPNSAFLSSYLLQTHSEIQGVLAVGKWCLRTVRRVCRSVGALRTHGVGPLPAPLRRYLFPHQCAAGENPKISILRSQGPHVLRLLGKQAPFVAGRGWS